MQIISRSQLGLAAPTQPLKPLRASQVVGIIVHQRVGEWRSIPWDGAFDIPYNFGLDPEGRILEGRGWDFQHAAGDTKTNSRTWTICYLSDNAITNAARVALTEFCQHAATLGPVTYVKPHQSFTSKTFLPSIDLHPPILLELTKKEFEILRDRALSDRTPWLSNFGELGARATLLKKLYEHDR